MLPTGRLDLSGHGNALKLQTGSDAVQAPEAAAAALYVRDRAVEPDNVMANDHSATMQDTKPQIIYHH